VALFTSERVKPLPNVGRIQAYALEVTAHRDEAVEVRRWPSTPSCPDAVDVAGFFVCGAQR
jgi:hypothetical protein